MRTRSQLLRQAELCYSKQLWQRNEISASTEQSTWRYETQKYSKISRDVTCVYIEESFIMHLLNIPETSANRSYFLDLVMPISPLSRVLAMWLWLSSQDVWHCNYRAEATQRPGSFLLPFWDTCLWILSSEKSLRTLNPQWESPNEPTQTQVWSETPSGERYFSPSNPNPGFFQFSSFQIWV